MSKKNRLSTRQNAHTYALEREKEAADKRKRKQEKNREQQASRAGASGMQAGAASDRKMPGFTPGLQVKKMKRKGIRIRKHAVVRGVRIKDAASKHKARRLLAEEAEEREMAVEGESASSKPKKASFKGTQKKKTMKKPAAKPKSEEAVGMAVD